MDEMRWSRLVHVCQPASTTKSGPPTVWAARHDSSSFGRSPLLPCTTRAAERMLAGTPERSSCALTWLRTSCGSPIPRHESKAWMTPFGHASRERATFPSNRYDRRRSFAPSARKRSCDRALHRHEPEVRVQLIRTGHSSPICCRPLAKCQPSHRYMGTLNIAK